MNKIITTFATALLATAVFAGPGGHGGRGGHGGGHRPATVRQMQHAQARPAGGRHAVSQRAPTRPAVHRPVGGHGVASRHGGPIVGHRPPPRPQAHYRHHRHWARPPMPPVRPLALYGWTWIATPWTILVDGVYCSGDGYWFDGYNYYYNDCYYTSAPVNVNVSFVF